MASYIVLSPPGGEARDERNRFVKDGFAFWAALFPFLWALTKRLYVEATVFLALQIGLAILADDPQFELPAGVAAVALGLLWGFEARNWQANRLEKAGWQQQAIIVAQSLGDAEAMFYGSAGPAKTTAKSLGRPAQTADSAKAGNFALGLMDFDKGRS